MTHAVIVTILTLFQCAMWVQLRLSIISGSPASVLVRSGDTGRLFCQSSHPWLLCVWKGPGGLAVTKTQGQECQAQGARSAEVRVTGRGTRCELEVSRVGPEDAGDYSCILADSEDVVTVTRKIFLNVGIEARVSWLQGSVFQYVTGHEVSLSCVATVSNPPPNLVVLSDELGLTEVGGEKISADEIRTGFARPSPSSSSLSKTVLVDTSDLRNNTLISCHAEQRDELSGSLIYNSSVAIIRLEQVFEPLALAECLDWYCEYQIFLFIMLVMVVLIIISCCGIYFFFATRGKPYNVIMYNSEHGTWNRDDTVEDMKENFLEKKTENNFNNNINGGLGLRADIIRTNDILNQSLYSQVDKSKKTAREAEDDIKFPPPVLETNFDNTNDDSILQRVNTDFDTTNESSSFISKDNQITSLDTSQNNASLGDMSEEERKGFLLTMTEEEIMLNSTETTLETIYRRYKNKGRSRDTLTEEELDDEFIAETEIRKYALHKYHLANVKNVKRLGRTYSKVVRDHLNNDPKLAVSESSVEFEVARPSSSLSFCNRSNTSTPLTSRRGTPNPGK